MKLFERFTHNAATEDTIRSAVENAGYTFKGKKMSPVFTALMIPFLGTALGSGFVFFMKRDMKFRQFSVSPISPRAGA